MISSSVRLQLECDHGPGICLRQPTVIAAATEYDARNTARSRGWYLNGSECLCPPHAIDHRNTAIESLRLSSRSPAMRAP